MKIVLTFYILTSLCICILEYAYDTIMYIRICLWTLKNFNQYNINLWRYYALKFKNILKRMLKPHYFVLFWLFCYNFGDIVIEETDGWTYGKQSQRQRSVGIFWLRNPKINFMSLLDVHWFSLSMQYNIQNTPWQLLHIYI